ncbi:adenosylcobinamide-phosphate synthase CbiB [Methylomarinum vadi]|uniref:adenosylcobinamide-phosphate synthase CbiB n=1 Tax=Methylomarinum vadi TaxID=438855 RepID=UPI0004DFCD3C|nr:adenosylcobinamide-phosphate synthase CbiB [Methylomarinum vadi]
MTLTSNVILAILLDHWLGEPRKHHPLIAFGKLADYMERRLRRPEQSPRRQQIAGLLAFCLTVMPLTALLFLLMQLPMLDSILPALALYFCIAANSLKRHAETILHHLQQQNPPAARQAVGYIVSRETDRMGEEDIRKATIESVLENGADAVFAPLFWFVAAGPAGALLYRLTNTLDAMWGYKNSRYLYFGRAAARCDDALNWLPARLTAFSYALLGHARLALDCWRRQAEHLDSPNAGPVMCAGAGALDLRLGGPAYYHGRLKNKIHFGTDKATHNHDIDRANRLIDKTLFCWLLIIAIGDSLA